MSPLLKVRLLAGVGAVVSLRTAVDTRPGGPDPNPGAVRVYGCRAG